ncbi:MAG TPA: type VI secretion system contractile sheath large subunit [Longimicrobium sp.]|nr:type VI secretion system contractile sheath large subunit [Longimicrobium sp.]
MAKTETATAEAPAADATTTTELTVLDTIVRDGRMARDADQDRYARNLVGEFATQVLDDGLTVGNDTIGAIKKRIQQIDELISKQLNEVLHAPDFQKLEASWRGLDYLVSNTETGTQLKIRLLNATRGELQDDLAKAVEFDQSTLFKKIYEEEYGTFGGHPFSFLVADFEVGRSPMDMEFITKLSNVAAAAHAPLLAAASEALFDLASFTDLGTPRDLAKIFESAELIKWRSFRESEDSRYVALVLPHVLMRLPYGPKTKPVDGVDFREDVTGRDHSKYLWGSPAYTLAQRITNAFSLYGWTAAIRGVEGGGKVEGLPAHTFRTDEGDVALKCPTELAITDRREKELNDLGFISLCHCKGTDYAAFFGGATTQLAKTYNTNEANANARVSALLPYVLAASRFAHYLKVIVRDKIGSFQSREELQKYLNTWIADYVLLADGAPQSTKAKFPLREARVDVLEVPGKPGSYTATVFLRPHFQLEELTASIRLVATLPPPAA